MGEEREQRHLAAILAADVVGYSRLMERDEAGTLAALKALRAEVFEPRTREHGGRIFKIAGDGALCEFSCLLVALAHFHAERYADASAWADKALRDAPRYGPTLSIKLGACGLAGQLDEARAYLSALDSGVTCANRRFNFGPFLQPSCLERLVDGLRKAGLPE
jgi:hypothetical protein